MAGFPSQIREQALVLAARHCCVCRRYKGLGVEVHHIKPKAEGGSDLLDNAIVLCFDCHMNAGHYNPQHPKGTKYSRSELQKQREAWYAIVQKGGIAEPSSMDEMSVIARYVMTEDVTALNDVIEPRAKDLPFGEFTLLQLEKLLKQIRHCSSVDGPSMGDAGNYGEVFESAEALEMARPGYKGNDWRSLESIDQERLPELWNRVLAAGAAISDLGYVRPCNGACGGDTPSGWWEDIILRKPCVVFLQVRNTNSYPIRIHFLNVREEGQKNSAEFVTYSIPTTEVRKQPLPSIAIDSNASLLIPVGVLYGPLRNSEIPAESERILNKSPNNTRSECDRIESTVYDSNLANTFARFGFWMSVVEIGVELQSGSTVIPVHDFDPTKPFTVLSTQWNIGSCPHIFWLTAESSWLYGGEILKGANEPNSSATTSCIAPNDVTGFQVCEFEYEVTKIDWIEVNGIRVAEDVVLTKGESAFYPVQAGATIGIRGHYVAAIDKPSNQDHIRQKYELLDAAMMQMSSSYWTLRASPLWQ